MLPVVQPMPDKQEHIIPSNKEQISQNPRRVAHCKVSSLVMVCKRSLAAKASLLAIETALLTRRQQSADHKDKVCRVGVTIETSCYAVWMESKST